MIVFNEPANSLQVFPEVGINLHHGNTEAVNVNVNVKVKGYPWFHGFLLSFFVQIGP
jgi:hypothetical protein